MNLADRMNNIPPYVFAVVADRIREKKAQGIDILNLGIVDWIISEFNFNLSKN